MPNLAMILLRPDKMVGHLIHRVMPKGLFWRSLVSIVALVLLLQSIAGYIFLERHYETVTRRLSEAVARQIATLVAMVEIVQEQSERGDGYGILRGVAARNLGIAISILPDSELPPPTPRPYFDALDRHLTAEISARIDKPFWIDTVGQTRYVEIRILLANDAVLRVLARRSQAYASNSHIFIVWMVVVGIIVITIAVLFMRNQVKPLEMLAEAAENFGKGRPVSAFRPRGATEVRRAIRAFFEMRQRIERQIEQRTTMLAGVGHDLRTILTRFRLQLSVVEGKLSKDEMHELNGDIDEMKHMLEDYLAFARGEGNQESEMVDLAQLAENVAQKFRSDTLTISVHCEGEMVMSLRKGDIRRCFSNLIENAARVASNIVIQIAHSSHHLQIAIDDDGPGIAEEERERVFRPFYRGDAARNQDSRQSGLGLSIARDIANSHGGSLKAEENPLGGARMLLYIPQ